MNLFDDQAFRQIPGQLALDTDARNVRGQRHVGENGQDCNCGCQFVVGLAGRVVDDADTPKLLALDPPMIYAAFDVPSSAGGASREQVVAYYVSEVQS